MAQIPELERLIIPLEDVMKATNNFSNDNFIGQGGFGKVYTGQLIRSTTPGEPISSTVAVKRLQENISGQGKKEFLMEIMMLASYKHENLVTLVGFSDESDEKIIVYEEEVNGSLDKYIDSSDLTWEKRLRICLGAARGLDYLHSGVSTGCRVLHRDIKSSNILLNANWEAKLSDFGLSRIGPRDQEFSFLVTHAAGTHGYADPQYLETGVFSKESDVFSFGVVLFEVLCGRLAMKSEYHDVRRFLYILVKHHYKQGRLDEIIMASLKEQMKPHTLHTISTIAYQCLNDDRKQRPTMRSVVQELQISLEFQMGCRHMTQLWGSSTGGSSWSWQFDSNQKLKRITIDHEDWIYSISFTSQDSDGSSISSQQYGGCGGSSNGQFSEINFDADEEIVEIHGTVGVTTGYYAGYIVISSLTFVTNKKRDGPFGKEKGTPFSVTQSLGKLAGFYGRGGFYMDGLGFYLNVGA